MLCDLTSEGFVAATSSPVPFLAIMPAGQVPNLEAPNVTIP